MLKPAVTSLEWLAYLTINHQVAGYIPGTLNLINLPGDLGQEEVHPDSRR